MLSSDICSLFQCTYGVIFGQLNLNLGPCRQSSRALQANVVSQCSVSSVARSLRHALKACAISTPRRSGMALGG